MTHYVRPSRGQLIAIVIIIVATLLFGISFCTPGNVRAAARVSIETDAQQMKRLRSEKLLAQVDVDEWHRKLRPYAMQPTAPGWMLDSLGAARVRLDLATRNLNRAMR